MKSRTSNPTRSRSRSATAPRAKPKPVVKAARSKSTAAKSAAKASPNKPAVATPKRPSRSIKNRDPKSPTPRQLSTDIQATANAPILPIEPAPQAAENAPVLNTTLRPPAQEKESAGASSRASQSGGHHRVTPPPPHSKPEPIAAVPSFPDSPLTSSPVHLSPDAGQRPPSGPPPGYIRVRGAAEHNLDHLNVDLPRERMIVVTGLSGSGKSSLAFDTIFAEGQRRYVESLSTYARQFLDQMEKPNVESIDGLTPTIAIEQRTGHVTPRSTVATTTEIYDYLRVLFARQGHPTCPQCGRSIVPQTPQQIAEQVMAYPTGSKIMLLAPLVRGQKGSHKEIIDHAVHLGFARLRVDGALKDAREKIDLPKTFRHSIEAVVDRILVKPDARSRVIESVEMALKVGEGLCIIAVAELEKGQEIWKDQVCSEHFACPEHGSVLSELTPRLFSFNSPYGACETCDGLGYRMEPDPALVVPDEERSIPKGAVKAWRRCGSGIYWSYGRAARYLCRIFGVSPETPWKKLPAAVRKAMLFGSAGEKVEVTEEYEGIIPNLLRRFHKTDSEAQKLAIHEFMSNHDCTACHGARLKPGVLAVKIDGRSIAEVCHDSIDEAVAFFKQLRPKLEEANLKIWQPLLKEIENRLGFLSNVGLGYLSLDRTSATLSGGEAQRIRLASQVGSKLVGVTYVLDEPTIGLHQRDNDRLIATLQALRDLGNTVLIVEHDEDVIRSADWILDLGPGAGHQGGKITAQGDIAAIMHSPESLTAKYLSGEMAIPIPETRRPLSANRAITVKGAAENNLKNIDAAFPLGGFLCVTGISGSGKSSLVNECLLKGLQRKMTELRVLPGKFHSIHGHGQIDSIIDIDQSPIGRTPRSNPATYTGVFDEIRRLFAKAPEAKIRGYDAGRFSFNVKGGRCEHCQGQGVRVIAMHFLADVHVICEVCNGARYNQQTLEVLFKEKSIADVLAMSVEESLEFFANHPAIRPYLETLFDVGLGYIKLGQASTTLSGGEAQRIKLAFELAKRPRGHTLYILDEPTTGLHFHDIRKLLEVLHRLVDRGNSVIVIEHNLDVIKTADWIIDLGPEGGAGGGEILFTGPAEKIVACQASYTGQYLKRVPGFVKKT
ncbi:MAG: excinuclease ABC subunit UvrA [Planctomycetota bacterium]